MSDAELESAVRTHGRSVLRPHGAKSAKKYARHLADHSSRHGTAADIDTNDSAHSEASDNDVRAQDTPSKRLSSTAINNRKTTAVSEVPANKNKDVTASTTVPHAKYYESVGPGDVWTCLFDGCNERVYDARTPAAMKLITLHFSNKHADRMEDLIKAEMRPYNKVDHLLSRVKDLASLRALLGDVDGPADSRSLDVGVVRQY